MNRPLDLPSSYEVIYDRARRLERQQNWEEARVEYRRLVTRLASLKPAHLHRRPELETIYADATEALAELEAAKGNFEEGIVLLERLAARQPENASLYSRRIAIYRVMCGEMEEGLAALQALAQAEPDNPWNTYALAEALTEAQRYQEARQVVDPLSVVRGSKEGEQALIPALAARLLLRIAEAQKDVDLALEAWARLEKALAFLHDAVMDPRVGERLVLLLVEAGAFDLARQHLRHIPYRGLRRFVEGYLQWAQGEQDAARETWERLTAGEAQQEEVDPRPWAFLALGRPDEALELLVPPGTSPIDTLTLRAVALAQRGDLDEAVTTMEQALLEIRIRTTQGRLPIAAARLWRNFLPPEAWERLAPFFTPEPG